MAVKRQRTGVPVSEEELHGWRSGTEAAGWIHFNAAGASPPHASTHNAMVSHLELECKVGGYAAAAQRLQEGGRDAHVALAELLSCEPKEIALVESAQVAWAKAFYSLDFRPGDRIFCFASEYAGNAVAFLQSAKKHGAELKVLPMTANGVVDVAMLESELAAMKKPHLEESCTRRALVALTHVQTDSSIIQPAAEVGAIAKAHGAVYLLDACQTVGQMDVDVRKLQCDFACGTGRKWLRGPRGTGFLYARTGALPEKRGSKGLVGEPPLIDHVGARWTSSDDYELEEAARRYEMWESSEAARAGLAAAVDVCLSVGPARIHELSSSLAVRLRQGLAAIPGILLRDTPGSFESQSNLSAIVTFDASALGIESAAIRDALAERKIGVSVSPSNHTFDQSLWKRPPTVRLSPTYFNTKEEVDSVVETIREVLATLESRPRQ